MKVEQVIQDSKRNGSKKRPILCLIGSQIV